MRKYIGDHYKVMKQNKELLMSMIANDQFDNEQVRWTLLQQV